MTIPLITCSARLPVYILLVATLACPKIGGVLSLQALAFFGLYFLGSFCALFMALKIFRLTYFKGKSQYFVIDLPEV